MPRVGQVAHARCPLLRRHRRDRDHEPRGRARRGIIGSLRHGTLRVTRHNGRRDAVVKVAGREVRVALRHRDRAVTHERAHAADRRRRAPSGTRARAAPCRSSVHPRVIDARSLQGGRRHRAHRPSGAGIDTRRVYVYVLCICIY